VLDRTGTTTPEPSPRHTHRFRPRRSAMNLPLTTDGHYRRCLCSAIDNRHDLEAWLYPTISTGVRDVMIKEGTNVDIYNMYARNGAVARRNVFVGGVNKVVRDPPVAHQYWSHLADLRRCEPQALRQRHAGSLTGDVRVDSDPRSAGIGGNSIWVNGSAVEIDDVRIYNRALTAAELVTDMNTPVPTRSGLAAASLQDQSAQTAAATMPRSDQPLASLELSVWLIGGYGITTKPRQNG